MPRSFGNEIIIPFFIFFVGDVLEKFENSKQISIPIFTINATI